MLDQVSNLLSFDVVISDSFKVNKYDILSVMCPLAGYWLLALFFHLLPELEMPSLEQYRIQPKQPKKNKITVTHVVLRVLFQQLLMSVITIIGIYLQQNPPDYDPHFPLWIRSVKFMWAMFVMDTYQYWVHRLMHTNKFLYQKVHSVHHQLLMPYAFGALYNHPVEALFLDICGGAVTIFLSFMPNDPLLATIFFNIFIFKNC